MEQPLPTSLVAGPPPLPPPLPPPAPAMAAQPAGFHVGGFIARTLRISWKNALPFSLMALVAMAPIFTVLVDLFRLALGGDAPPPESFDDYTALGLKFVVAWVATIALQVVQLGAVLHATFHQLRGQRVGLGEMLGAGVRRGLSVLGTGLLMWLGSIIGLLALLVPGVLLKSVWCVVLGLLALIPGLVLLLVWSVSLPATVVERVGPLTALRRSRALTRGQRWPVLAGFLALGAIFYVVTLVIQVPMLVIGVAVSSSPQGMLVPMLISQLLGAVIGQAMIVAMGVAYHDLRASKEGPATDQLAAVFE
jgi:hypothetical protein